MRDRSDPIRSDPITVHALDVIRRRATEIDLRETDVSAELGLSTRVLSRHLTRSTGDGFWAHLHGCRCRLALALLEERALSIKQVAAACGYRRTSDFDRAFLRRFGTTPTGWRALLAAAWHDRPFAKQ